MTVIIDSGAFTAWSSGNPINLDEYIDYCKNETRPDHYVALDVIPGVGGKKNQTITNSDILSCCKQSVENYAYMIERLPQDKLIPVYHQGDPIEYLYRYYEMGARYIGVSPNNNMTTLVKKAWLTEVALKHMPKFPDLKTHGFGVNSFRLIDCFPWFSVDSTAWARQAMTGYLMTPRLVRGVYDYSKSPLLLPIAPASRNYGKLTRTEVRHVRDYVEHLGMPFGKWVPPKTEASFGFDVPCSTPTAVPKHLRKEMTVIEDGVAINPLLRCVANCLYLQEAVNHLRLEKIYLASFLQGLPYEHLINNRLFSFVNVKQKSIKIALDIQFNKGEVSGIAPRDVDTAIADVPRRGSKKRRVKRHTKKSD